MRIEGKGIRMEIYPGDGLAPVEEIQPEPLEHLPLETLSPIRAVVADPEVELVPIQKIPADGNEEPASVDENSTPPQVPYVNDYRVRVLVIDALRSCEYPAPAHVIGQHCLELSNKRSINLPNRRLNQLLTTAKKIGLLQPALGENAQPNYFVFIETANLVARFLDDEA